MMPLGKISEVKEEARELAYAGALAAQPSLASVNVDEAKKGLWRRSCPR
jgi:hypothetical protein